MNYQKMIEGFLERKNGSSMIPGYALWGLRHIKVIMGIAFGFVALCVLLTLTILVLGVVYVFRHFGDVPINDQAIDVGRRYFEQQFNEERQQLDQLQRDVQDVRNILLSPAPSPVRE